MGFPVVVNGNTYNESDFTGYGYKTALPSMINDTATVASAASISATNAQTYSTTASQWASLTSGIVGSTDYSAKAWAIGGTGVTDTASKGAAKEWAVKTTGTVDGSDYSAKYYAQAAAASYDSFDDRYLGAKSSDPTLDNDGNALLTGALYYKTTATAGMRIYNGSAWEAVGIPISGTLTTSDIGTTIQAYSATLTSWAAILPSAKQDALVSGSNIKTVNGTSLLGSGDILVQSAGSTLFLYTNCGGF